ncbi:MAG: tRNA (adenosine(37)-N6)-threonylcarbamoyltransferase complex ATPase subunit type 1 TsaE, partial [Akkermansiaceae bacterium]|nr:tRNA (adenosine(37)-N6)-threonylcarbamoyltransferase complex ATPase subunit type 1 TsaE [Akkermansiaceae bacterium]
GKTCLVRGILEGLGASVPASSPTFSLVHEHRDGRIPAVHFDFYRLRSPEEALSFGWEDYWDCGAVLLVEWADKFGGALMPGGADWLFLRHAGAGERTVEWR